MNEATVTLAIKARDEATAVIDKVKTNAGGMSSAFGKIGSIAAGVGLAGVGQEALGFFKDAISSAADMEMAQLKLQQATENTGASWDAYKEHVNGAVDAAMKMGFNDEETRNSLALLMAQTSDAGEAMKRFALAQDLSRGSGLDLETASRLLGKVTEDNVTALQRYGIHIAKGATETELFAAVQAKFGGQAEVFSNSTAGGMARVKVQIQELKEQIGGFLLPIVMALANFALNTLIPALAEFVTQIQDGINAARDWAANNDQVQAALGKVRDVLAIVNPKVQEFGQFLKDHEEEVKIFAAAVGVTLVVAFGAWAVSAALAAAATLLALAPIILVGIAIGLLAVGIFELVKHWDEIKAKTLEVWNAIATFMQEKLGFLVLIAVFYFESIRNQVETAINAVRDIIRIVMALLHGDWGEAWAGIKQLVLDLWDGLITDVGLKVRFLWDAIVMILTTLGPKLYDIGRDMVTSMLDGIDGMLGSLWSKLEDIAGKIAEKLNPKNWVGSPKGLQNWLPYYYEQGLRNLDTVMQRRSFDAGVTPHRMMVGGGDAASGMAVSNTYHVYIDQWHQTGDPTAGLAALGAGI